MRILALLQDRKQRESLVRVLTKNRFGVDGTDDVNAGLGMALTGVYGLIIVDTRLKVISTMDVILKLRAEMISTPIMVLSFGYDPASAIRFLDAGADDYVSVPYDIGVLTARIRALSRRGQLIVPDEMISFGDITLNMATYELVCGDARARLGAKEMSLTELLIRSGERIISKEEIIVVIWGYDSEAEYNNVEVYISLLRKKLKAIGSSVRVHSVRGVGYKLVPPETA